MQIITAERQPVTVARGEPATRMGGQLLDGDGIVTDPEGRPVAIQVTVARNLAGQIPILLRHIGWTDVAHRREPNPDGSSQSRLSGILATSATFGYRPPVEIRKRDNCSRCDLDSKYPDLAACLYGAGRMAAHALAEHAPDAYARTFAGASAIPSAWKMPGVPWTSGIINGNNALPYHRDSGNVKGSWSAMLGMKRNCDGGWLHLAEWDVWLTIPDGSITLFDGQAVMHGVSPFRITHPAGYRFTAVWYARSRMARCAADPRDEARRAQRAADARAERAAAERKARRQ